MSIRTIMLKQGMPTVAEGRSRLNAEIDSARQAGVVALKVIHGYGSTGVGGALRNGVRASLRKRRKEGRIRAFVAGEQWDVFDATTQAMIEACPDLGRDGDLRRGNEGVTVILL